MKKLLTIAIILTLSLMATAQNRFDASLWLGFNLGQIDGDGAGHYTHFGVHGAVQTSFSVTKDPASNFRLAVELGVTQKGANKANTSIRVDLLYVEMPILATYSLFHSRLRLGAGIAPAYLARAKVSDAGVRENDTEAAYRRFDALPVCLDVTYFFNSHWGFNFRFNTSLISIMDSPRQGTYRISRKNQGVFNNYLSFNAAYRF